MTLLLTCLLAVQADVVRDAAEQAQKINLNAEIVWQRTSDAEPYAPVLVSIDNPGEEIRGELVVGWGAAEAMQNPGPRDPAALMDVPSARMDVLVPKGARRRHFVYVRGRYPNPGEELRVLLMADGKIVARFSTPQISRLGTTDVPPRVGVVGTGGLGGLASTRADTPLVRTDQLPDHWFGYRPLLALVWTDADPGAMYDASQLEALRRWTASGGHLVLAPGDATRFRGTFLEKIAPVTVGPTATHEDWSPLGTLAGADAPQGRGSILRVRPRKGAVSAVTADGVPLVVAAPYGRGRVTFLAFDPYAAPFSDWRDSQAFWTRLLAIPPPPSSKRRQGQPMYSDEFTGYVGSASAAALLRFHGDVPAPSLGWVLFLIFVYVLIVGPVDFLVLRRLRKMELTWITFPACVVLFSSITLLSGASMPTRRPLYRETQVIDHHPAIDFIQGRTFGSLMTLTGSTYSISATEPDAAVASFNNQTGPSGVRSDPGRVLDWTLPRGDTGTTVMEWCAQGSPLTVSHDAEGRLVIRNGTPHELRAAFYVDGDGIYPLPTVPPGDSVFPLKDPIPARGSGFSRAGIARPHNRPSNYGYYYYGYSSGQSRDEIRKQLRLEMGYLAFRDLAKEGVPAPPKGRRDSVRGLMKEFDASPWIRSGGACLVGWTSGPVQTRLEGEPAESYTDTFVRVFIR